MASVSHAASAAAILDVKDAFHAATVLEFQ
jgi:hypothetical protein